VNCIPGTPVGRSPVPFALAVAFAIGFVSGCSKSATLPSTCAATQMTPQLTPLGGAASQSIWQLALNNKSHSTCLLEGFLGVYAQDQDHQNIAEAEAIQPDEQRLIRVRPGMTVYSELSFAYYHPDTGEQCKDIAWWLRVGLPDDKGTLDVNIGPPPGPDKNSTTFSLCGGLTIGPIETQPVG
jgi:uncharacterized protein DUF4232